MNKDSDPLILLDTHVWLWLISGDPRAKSPGFLRLIEKRGAEDAIRVSIISIWEIGVLSKKGRIVLQPYGAMEWVHQALRFPGISIEPLSPEIAIDSTNLPGDFHADPADRILIATTRNLNATLITEDERILSYCQEHHFSAHAI